MSRFTESADLHLDSGDGDNDDGENSVSENEEDSLPPLSYESKKRDGDGDGDGDEEEEDEGDWYSDDDDEVPDTDDEDEEENEFVDDSDYDEEQEEFGGEDAPDLSAAAAERANQNITTAKNRVFETKRDARIAELGRPLTAAEEKAIEDSITNEEILERYLVLYPNRSSCALCPGNCLDFACIDNIRSFAELVNADWFDQWAFRHGLFLHDRVHPSQTRPRFAAEVCPQVC